MNVSQQMKIACDAIDSAIHEAGNARNWVARINTTQVRAVDDVALLKATAQTWFFTHRPIISANAPHLDLVEIDGSYTAVLNAAEKASTKNTYLSILKEIKTKLVALRAEALRPRIMNAAEKLDDIPPDFSPLAGNQQMRDILTRRWTECAKCVDVGAHLAAIVMMGGLLEALFVARANKLPDKHPLTSATNAPRDKSTGRTLNYQEWMLDSYIKVGCELKWITESAKDVADSLKEYRNFVHPAKELRYGVTLDLNDSAMFWQVTKALAKQLLLSASR